LPRVLGRQIVLKFVGFLLLIQFSAVVQAASGFGIPLRCILASFVSHLLHPAAIELFNIYQQEYILQQTKASLFK
jgi:hypothetical protein